MEDEHEETGLLQTIKLILSEQEKIKTVSDLAFDAVDLDESEQLDQEELATIMQEVATNLKVKAPNNMDIQAILAELDEDNDGQLDKGEFVQLIIMVFEKMLDNETDLIKSIKMKNDAEKEL